MGRKHPPFTFTIDSLKRWAGTHPLFVIIFIVLVSTSSFVTITDGFLKVKGYYLASFGKVQKAYQQVEQLTINTPISNFETTLGKPFLINRLEKYKEYIFASDYFYVQAVTDDQGRVLLYAITTRDKKFRPKFKTSFPVHKDEDLTIVLGKTRFSEIMSLPYDIYGFLSVNMASFYYNEKYYLGGSGRFRIYAVAYNGAGIGEVGELYLPVLNGTAEKSKLIEQIGESGFPEGLQLFREGTVINTYCIMSYELVFPLDAEEADGLTIGPNMSQLIEMQRY